MRLFHRVRRLLSGFFSWCFLCSSGHRASSSRLSRCLFCVCHMYSLTILHEMRTRSLWAASATPFARMSSYLIGSCCLGYKQSWLLESCHSYCTAHSCQSLDIKVCCATCMGCGLYILSIFCHRGCLRQHHWFILHGFNLSIYLYGNVTVLNHCLVSNNHFSSLNSRYHPFLTSHQAIKCENYVFTTKCVIYSFKLFHSDSCHTHYRFYWSWQQEGLPILPISVFFHLSSQRIPFIWSYKGISLFLL